MNASQCRKRKAVMYLIDSNKAQEDARVQAQSPKSTGC